MSDDARQPTALRMRGFVLASFLGVLFSNSNALSPGTDWDPSLALPLPSWMGRTPRRRREGGLLDGKANKKRNGTSMISWISTDLLRGQTGLFQLADFILLRGRTGLFELGLFCHTLSVARQLHGKTRHHGPVLAVVLTVLMAFGGGLIVPVLLGNDVFFPFPLSNDLAVPFVAFNVLLLRRLEMEEEAGNRWRWKSFLLSAPSAIIAVFAELARARIMLTWLRGAQLALPASYLPEPVVGPIILGSECASALCVLG